MRISDWSSDVCSSDLEIVPCKKVSVSPSSSARTSGMKLAKRSRARSLSAMKLASAPRQSRPFSASGRSTSDRPAARSEEHTSELQSLMRISYAVFCLKKKKKKHTTIPHLACHAYRLTNTPEHKQQIKE